MKRAGAIKRLAGVEDFVHGAPVVRTDRNGVRKTTTPVDGGVPSGKELLAETGCPTVAESVLDVARRLNAIPIPKKEYTAEGVGRIGNGVFLGSQKFVDGYATGDFKNKGDLLGERFDFVTTGSPLPSGMGPIVRTGIVFRGFRNGTLGLRFGWKKSPDFELEGYMDAKPVVAYEGDKYLFKFEDNNANVWVGAAENARGVMEFRNDTCRNALVFINCPSVEICNVTFKGGGEEYCAVYARNSSVSFRNCVFEDCEPLRLDGDTPSMDDGFTSLAGGVYSSLRKEALESVASQVAQRAKMRYLRDYIINYGADEVTGVSWVQYNSGRLVQYGRMEKSSMPERYQGTALVYKVVLPKKFKKGYRIQLCPQNCIDKAFIPTYGPPSNEAIADLENRIEKAKANLQKDINNHPEPKYKKQVEIWKAQLEDWNSNTPTIEPVKGWKKQIESMRAAQAHPEDKSGWTWYPEEPSWGKWAYFVLVPRVMEGGWKDGVHASYISSDCFYASVRHFASGLRRLEKNSSLPEFWNYAKDKYTPYKSGDGNPGGHEHPLSFVCEGYIEETSEG